MVADAELFPQGGHFVRVVLQDGTMLEGQLIVLSGRYEVGDVTFFHWEIETLEDIS